MTFDEFLRADHGVVTVDWVVLLGALTGLGIFMMQFTGTTLNVHSHNMRDELQDPHFETDWFDYVAVLPPSME